MDLDLFRENFEKVLEHLKNEMGGIRTNRATPAMLENIQVSVYGGSKMPIIQLGSIQAPEPTMLTIEVWDKAVLKDVEKAIQTASLGLSVVNEGTFLRVTVAPMTDDTRQEIIKALHGKLEEARQRMRGVRDDVKEKIVKAEREKEISEDERYKLAEDLDKMTREYNDEIKNMGDKKEEEIKL